MRLTLVFLAFTRLLSAQESITFVAFDKQSQPILDLKQDELKLLDNGRPQTIASLRRLDEASPSPAIILYDLLNTIIFARATVQQQIAQAVQEVPADSATYLYLLAGDATLIPVHGVDSTAGASWPRNCIALLDGALRNTAITRPSHLSTVGARVNATYTALIQLAARIAPLPGRKTVVWVTHGVPLHGITASDVPVDYLPTLKKIAAGISRESIVFYPVQQTAGALPGPGDTSPDTLQQFASITGGRVYANQTVDKALPEIMRDIAAAYILTYRAASTPEAQFHSLRLTSTRPGARMQFPQGH